MSLCGQKSTKALLYTYSPGCNKHIIHTVTNDLTTCRGNVAKSVGLVVAKPTRRFPSIPRLCIPQRITNISAEISRYWPSTPNVHLALHVVMVNEHLYDQVHPNKMHETMLKTQRKLLSAKTLCSPTRPGRPGAHETPPPQDHAYSIWWPTFLPKPQAHKVTIWPGTSGNVH